MSFLPSVLDSSREVFPPSVPCALSALTLSTVSRGRESAPCTREMTLQREACLPILSSHPCSLSFVSLEDWELFITRRPERICENKYEESWRNTCPWRTKIMIAEW